MTARAAILAINEKLNARHFRDEAQYTQSKAEAAARDLPALKEQAAKPWDKAAELAGKRERIKAVIAELSAGAATQKTQAPMPSAAASASQIEAPSFARTDSTYAIDVSVEPAAGFSEKDPKLARIEAQFTALQARRNGRGRA